MYQGPAKRTLQQLRYLGTLSNLSLPRPAASGSVPPLARRALEFRVVGSGFGSWDFCGEVSGCPRGLWFYTLRACGSSAALPPTPHHPRTKLSGFRALPRRPSFKGRLESWACKPTGLEMQHSNRGHHRQISMHLVCVDAGRVFAPSRTGTSSCPTPRSKDRHLHRPPSHALGFNSSWQPTCQRTCTSQRRRGMITHQPEDVPYGECGRELPCYPPLSHGSSSTPHILRAASSSSSSSSSSVLFPFLHASLFPLKKSF